MPNKNNDNPKRKPLSERLKDIECCKCGITDPEQIGSILKAMCDVRLENALTLTDCEKIGDTIKLFEDQFRISFRDHNLRFIDLIAIISLEMENDLRNSDYFIKDGVTKECDIQSMSLHCLYRFFGFALINKKLSTGYINKAVGDFMNINFRALQKYFYEKYNCNIFSDFNPKFIKEFRDNSMTMSDIFLHIRNTAEQKWMPFFSLYDYVRDIRRSYKQLYDIFYVPFMELLEKEYMPEECTEYDYLMRVSFQDDSQNNTENNYQKGSDNNG